MHRFCDELLASAAFAMDKDGRAAWRHLRHQIKHPEHDVALADDVLEVVALLQRALELLVFFFRTATSQGGADVGKQLLVVPRLGDEVARAYLHRPDGIVYRPVRRDHDDR